MKEHKHLMKYMFSICVFSALLCVISEYSLFPRIQISIVNEFSFFSGHRMFFTNILLGIAGSSFLVGLNAMVSYFNNKERVQIELKRHFALMVIALRQGIRVSKYDEIKMTVSEVGELYKKALPILLMFNPIIEKNPHNIKTKELYYAIGEVNEQIILSSPILRKIEELENEKMLIDRAIKNLTLKSIEEERRTKSKYIEKLIELNSQIDTCKDKYTNQLVEKFEICLETYGELLIFFGLVNLL